MQNAFKTHSSWNDLNNPQSDFVLWLQKVCSDDDDTEVLSVFKLRNIGILWCEGDSKEKASELFENMQDNDAPTIACNDKDFKPNLYALFNFATEMVFINEPIYKKKLREISDDAIETAKENYDDIAEEFLDTIFESESKLSRKDWEIGVSKH